ncbi:signal peptidase I [Cellulomonas sp. Leaf334]|uniref:signal peptidase I n=1 Tax=Cellulomonas sp. Leaf334 TaxID=1736339 RepID=UPI000AA1CC8A|nr:signal peptidase I [Cellulomonas sp. Leaf334]
MTGPGAGRLRRWVSGTLSSLALVCIAGVALVMIVVPLAMKATPFTVLTGSMQPSMPPGTLVVSRPTPVDDIAIGDVVTYQLRSNEPDVVTHRVIGLGWDSTGERSLITRGDANTMDDEPVRAVQVRGTVAYAVPYLGYVNTWVGINRPGWLLKVVAGALMTYGLVLVVGGARERLRRRAATGADEPDAEAEPTESSTELAETAQASS